MQWPKGWKQVTLDMAQALEAELKREVVPGNPLHSVSLRAIARRNDCDDVLFAVADSESVAVVHLSYRSETSPLWPDTKLFHSFSELGKAA